MEINDPPFPVGLESALFEHVFSKWDPDFLKTPEGEAGKQEVLINRFNNALRFTIPWLKRNFDLANSCIVEIGCGSGSSTAALGHHCREVVGFDIDADAVKAAEARCRAYGLSNVRVQCVASEELLPSICSLLPKADIYLLYAVIEHQTYKERIDTLATLWNLLEPGGALAIIETPNRFVYLDKHTSDLAFYHLLPDELAFQYIHEVPRLAFKNTLEPLIQQRAWAQASEMRVRWGLGASYHEFDIALKEPLDEILIADGFEQEMVDFFPIDIDEKLLTQFFYTQLINKPIGFSRAVLNLILRKPKDQSDRRKAADFAYRRREQIGLRLSPPPPQTRVQRVWAQVRSLIDQKLGV